MAETTETKKTRKTTSKTTTAKTVAKSTPTPKKRIVIPKDEEFIVKSNCIGGLLYESRDKSLYFDWENYGDEKYLTFEELQKIKNSNRKFFEANWIVVEGNENFSANDVYIALRVDQYYKCVYEDLESIDYLFDLSNEEISARINEMTKGYRETIAQRAKELIDMGEIDSIKKIKNLSALLNCDFGID